ncbi:MAG: MBL fold metallo-hydrolase [Myxococcota bacterium]|nr:MBL fold metallo-hydrolase [Myxococcota bacterium]
MKVVFRGVRGSIPIASDHTVRYGGNSSCVEIQAKEGPPLILDCGTGVRSCGMDLLRQRVQHVEVLFTHFHMDHLFGFPFFGPLYSPSCRINVSVPAESGIDAQNKLSRYLNGIYHPLRVRDIPSTLNFTGLKQEEEFQRGPYKIKAVTLNHPGGSCGYRVEADDSVVLYLTDTAPMTTPESGLSAGKKPPEIERRLLQAMEEADVVIMDTMFSYEEYLERITWGHAYPEYAVKLCELAGVKQLYLFHHAPDASDDQLDELADYWSKYDGGKDGILRVKLAAEKDCIDLS